MSNNKKNNYLQKIEKETRNAQILKDIALNIGFKTIGEKYGVTKARISQIKKENMDKVINETNFSAISLVNKLAEDLNSTYLEVCDEIEMYKNSIDKNGKRNAPVPPDLFQKKINIQMSIAKLFCTDQRVMQEFNENKEQSNRYIFMLDGENGFKDDSEEKNNEKENMMLEKDKINEKALEEMQKQGAISMENWMKNFENKE